MSEAKQQFAEYFAKNYPADTVIVDPHWHAQRIFRAALAALSAEQPEPVAYRYRVASGMTSEPCWTFKKPQPEAILEAQALYTSPIIAPSSQPVAQDILSLIANLSAVVRVQNGNLHDDTNALLEHADRVLAASPIAPSQPDAAAIRNKALHTSARQMYFATTELLTACHAADSKEELGSDVDGAIMDRVAQAMICFEDAERALATQSEPAQQEPCVCVEPNSTGTVHRTDGPCYVVAPTAQQAGQPAPALPEGWISTEDRIPEVGTLCLVYSRQPWEEEPTTKIDTWDEQHESPVGFSSATVPIGPGWDEHEDFYSVTHWMPLPAAPSSPAEKGESK